MPNWSTPGTYPPPRRSRSRSPRGMRYPPESYPSDPYRPEWEYDRAWPNYDRDRALYGRRNSRSPVYGDDSRKRRRSVSPFERDRYEPRPRYGDDYDAHSRSHGYGSPPRRGNRRAPPDPHTLDYPASLKQYAEWFRYFFPQQAQEEDTADKVAEQEAGDGSRPRNGIKSRWEKYKKDFANSQLQVMFEHHRKSPWFAERYDPAPDQQALRTRTRKEGWEGRLDKFLLDLESGAFDPDINEPTEEEPASPMKEQQEGANGLAEDVKREDDDDAFDFGHEDEGGNNDSGKQDTQDRNRAEAAKRGRERGEEVSVEPEGNTVMIRTIPPDIGRVKLEAACSSVPGFMYLALGDPLQKRNFYRAGWIRLADDTDMSFAMTELAEKKIEGFKLHVSNTTRPFVNKIRYAPEVASKPERLEKDLANVKALTSLLEEQAAALRKPSKNGENSEQNGQNGDVQMSPPPEKNETDQQEEQKESGIEAIERRVEKLMADLAEKHLLDTSNDESLQLKKLEVSLDLYIAYLRSAFHTCYYCALVTDYVEELQRKCIKHVRRPLPTPVTAEGKTAEVKAEDGAEPDESAKDVTEENEAEKRLREKELREKNKADDRWSEWLDSKIALLIDRDNVDPRDYGGKNYDEELAKAIEPCIKQEDEGKFRCKICQKLFKATAFVEKHVANKHPESIKSLEDISYFNNFALDPHRIQPFAHPPIPFGNSQQPPPQAYGISAPQAHHDFGGRHAPPHYNQAGGYPPQQGYGGGGGGGGNGGYWEPRDGREQFPPHGAPYGQSYPPPRRDEPMGGAPRRLSDRITGFPDVTSMAQVAGLPPKPTPAALDTALVAGTGGGGGGGRRGGGRNGGPPPPPPPDAKEDPRAAAGKRVSYHDMDLVAEGDVELQY
ncbi:hypothetical protein BDV98DRAFT_532986 [Pterulicium gracile]|uniref:C2H2-type domain-containing protein n=1 Tax=Pterulicium gracile TaxID=1884261 RepID=A0A5C3QAM4_9AGAR|nr:hypothetical protein BDV98DRAFT_532986 [Pterula gracilis]